MRKSAAQRRPPSARRPTCHPKDLPQEPGLYYWDTWDRVVRVYRKRSRKKLYVSVTPGVEVEVTPFIAGKFRKVES